MRRKGRLGLDGRFSDRPGEAMTMAEEKKPSRYVCLQCGYVYDPRRGDPKGGLEPGADLSLAPRDWACPRCGAGQDSFADKGD